MEKDERYLKAKKRVQKLKAFYIHLTVFVLVNLMLFAINLMSDTGNWWFFYPLLGWGIGLGAHALTTFIDGEIGSDWEERKIKEFMEKDKRNKEL